MYMEMLGKIKFLWLLAFAFTCAYTGFKYYNYLQTKPIYPVENSDGTIDYTLVDKNIYMRHIKKKPLQEDWVLRFPKEVTIIRPEETFKDGSFIIDGTKVILGQKPNSQISFYLKFDDFTFTKDFGEGFYRRVTRINLQANKYLRYETTKKFERTEIPRFNAFLHHDLCKIDKVVFPGLVKLRSPTDQERKSFEKSRVRYGFNKSLKQRCITEINDTEIYNFLQNGELLGTGSCYLNIIHDCYFNVWLPPNRVASISLNYEKLSELPKLYVKLIEIVKSATVEINAY